MKFDDRLATALRIGATSPAMSRIELRQLLDLLGSGPAHDPSRTTEIAYARIAELAQSIPPDERARILREPGLRLRSARLVALLGTSEPPVAEAAIARASLTAEEWQDLIPGLSPAARQAMRQRTDLPKTVYARLSSAGVYNRALARADSHPSLPSDVGRPAERQAGRIDGSFAGAETVPPVPGNDHHAHELHPSKPESISELVKRIETYRQARLNSAPPPGPVATSEAPHLPLGPVFAAEEHAPISVIDVVCNADGQVIWAPPEVAPMMFGMTLFGQFGMVQALRQRRPVSTHKVILEGAPAIAGAWQIDALPQFVPGSGAFTGFAGRLRRIDVAAASKAAPHDSEADRIRQSLHELRTPVNAIQGFAEVIQQQLFGPVPHEYRALAANIAGDAARMLAAFEDLERLAKLDSGASQLEHGDADLVEALTRVAAQLEERLAQRKVVLRLASDAHRPRVPLQPVDAELMIWRLLTTLTGAAVPGETLTVATRVSVADPAMIETACDLPASLRDKTENAIMQAAIGAVPQAIAAGMFGVGFALRLARAEAEAAGGALVLHQQRLILNLPDLTRSPPGHSARQSA